MAGFDSSDDDTTDVDKTPFQVDWLDLTAYECTEQLGISALPGCRFKDTWRNLDCDLATLKSLGVKDVYVLCTKGELNKYRTPWLLQELQEADFAVHHHAFPDGTVPQIPQLMAILQDIKSNLVLGRRSLVHCFGGLGRSCFIAACLLMLLDHHIDPETAIQRLKAVRGPGAIQSVKQYNFVQDFRNYVADFEEGREEASPESSRSVSR